MHVHLQSSLYAQTNMYIFQTRLCVSSLPILYPLLLVHQGVCPKNDCIQEHGFNSVASELNISHYHFL